MNSTTVWKEVLSKLEAEIQSVSYNTWITTIEPVSISDNNFTISVIDSTHKQMVQTKYYMLIKTYLSETVGEELELIVKTTEEIKQKEEESEASTLNPKYTFDTFVVGKSNEMAQAAAQAVSKFPGTRENNPLVLYGNSGLGKTHLMHAIGNYIIDKNKDAKIMYVTSETFTNELVYAISTRSTEEFRAKYRKNDVLMVDDIQFLTNKERTQEEFFHTFNSLHAAQKQIILSSDRPPKEIKTLEVRLLTRFHGGMMCDIQPPDYETRVAILKRKAETDNRRIDDEILECVASTIKTSIRDLEGVLNKIFLEIEIKGKIELSTADRITQSYMFEKVKPISFQIILDEISRYLDVRKEDILGKKRSSQIVKARQITMYMARNMLDISLEKIGAHLGGRDHTTIKYGVEKIDKDVKEDLDLNDTIQTLEKRIRSDK